MCGIAELEIEQSRRGCVVKTLFNKIIVICSTLLIGYAICSYLIDVASRKSASSPQKNATQETTAHSDDPIKAYYLGDYETTMTKLKPKAEAGDPVAQFYIGAMYFNGQGVDLDYETAYMWLTLSKESGNAEAKNGLALVKTKMKASQISKGESMVKQWKASHTTKDK